MAAISVISSIARSIVRTRRQQAEFAPLVALLGLGCGTGVVDVAPLGGVALSRRTGVPVSMNKKNRIRLQSISAQVLQSHETRVSELRARVRIDH